MSANRASEAFATVLGFALWMAFIAIFEVCIFGAGFMLGRSGAAQADCTEAAKCVYDDVYRGLKEAQRDLAMCKGELGAIKRWGKTGGSHAK